MRGSRKFCQRGPNFDNIFFLVDMGREDPSTTISGLSLCGSSCGDPESFLREGPNMTTFFYDKGREDPSTTMSGRFGGVPMMALY